MTRRWAIGLLVGSAATLLTGCDVFGASFRVRVTVEVQTPQGIKTGSSVMEMFADSRIAAGTQSTARYSAGLSKGEAVVVDLPTGPLFVLLTIPDANGSLAGAIFDALNGDGKPLTNDDMMTFVRKMGAAWTSYRSDIPRDGWPLMVRFRDIADPKSVERVDPQAIGVTRIRLETTRDAVTTGIEKRLAWLPANPPFADPDPEDGYFLSPEKLKIGHVIGSRDFSSEFGR